MQNFYSSFPNSNVGMNTIIDLPDGVKRIDLMGIGVQLIDETEVPVSEENPDGLLINENASVSVGVSHFKHPNPADDFILAFCGTDSQQTRRGVYIKQYRDGRIDVKLMLPVYATTEDAQNDITLEVGSSYKCNGMCMYKQ